MGWACCVGSSPGRARRRSGSGKRAFKGHDGAEIGGSGRGRSAFTASRPRCCGRGPRRLHPGRGRPRAGEVRYARLMPPVILAGRRQPCRDRFFLSLEGVYAICETLGAADTLASETGSVQNPHDRPLTVYPDLETDSVCGLGRSMAVFRDPERRGRRKSRSGWVYSDGACFAPKLPTMAFLTASAPWLVPLTRHAPAVSKPEAGP